jgi:3-hydroxyacyl-CoA dehydrogenase
MAKGVAGADLVVEAVFEDIGVKKKAARLNRL